MTTTRLPAPRGGSAGHGPPPRRQRGMVLIGALIVLLLVTLVGTSGVRTGALELQISSNEEQRLLALQTAQASAEEIAEDAANFPVYGAPGNVVRCTAALSCDDNSLTLASAVLSEVDNASIERIQPERGNPPRLVRASSARAFSSTYFRIDVDNDQEAHGRARVVQGYLKMINNAAGQ